MNWKKNIAKRKRQSREAYENIHGKLMAARNIKNACDKDKCYLRCSHNISENDRKNIFENFWKLDEKGKRFFYDKYSVRTKTAGKTNKTKISRRSFTFNYNLEVNEIKYKVCQTFFCGTLGINKTRIHYYHKNKVIEQNMISTTPKQGLHKKYSVDPDKIKLVHDHIKSFPVMDSHYCRKSTQKKYLCADLNLQKMYKLYVSSNPVNEPVKFWMYENIFNTEYNYSIFVPKKDICDKCSEFKVKRDNSVVLNEEETNIINNHLKHKFEAAQEKTNDKKKLDTVMIVFDLENVFAFSRANTGMFFYKRKFSSFN